MLAKHCVEIKPRHPTKGSHEVLAVVDEILAYHTGGFGSEKASQGLDDPHFLFEEPVALRTSGFHQRDADGVCLRPCNTDAGNVSVARFNVHGQVEAVQRLRSKGV